jgi:hypothetical protein
VNKPVHFFVGIDGSDMSHNCFLMAQQFIKKDDKLTIGHVYNESKTYISDNLKPERLKQKYESLIIGMGKNSLVLCEKL